MNYINVGNKVIFDTTDILAFCPASSISEASLKRALDLSGGDTKNQRTAIITKDGKIYLVALTARSLRKQLHVVCKEDD